MASINPVTRLSGLARRLVHDGLLTEEQANAASEAANAAKLSLVAFLVRDGHLHARSVAVAASLEYGVPLFDLDAIDPATMPLIAARPSLLPASGIGPSLSGDALCCVSTSVIPPLPRIRRWRCAGPTR